MINNGKQKIGSRLVFKVKRLANGEVNRYEAKLCARVDYIETYASTTQYDTIRILLAVW